MKCKVLRFQVESRGDRIENQMESEINSWLSVGWRLIGTEYDDHYGRIFVFLTYG